MVFLPTSCAVFIFIKLLIHCCHWLLSRWVLLYCNSSAPTVPLLFSPYFRSQATTGLESSRRVDTIVYMTPSKIRLFLGLIKRARCPSTPARTCPFSFSEQRLWHQMLPYRLTVIHLTNLRLFSCSRERCVSCSIFFVSFLEGRRFSRNICCTYEAFGTMSIPLVWFLSGEQWLCTVLYVHYFIQIGCYS